MCVIIHLLPEHSINEDILSNALHNNWHSWGIITKDAQAEKKKRLKVFRGVAENGDLEERDPRAGSCHKDFDEIKRIINDGQKLERFIHFRHATRGTVDMPNCHPLPLFENDDRQVFMMHNGSFSGNLGGFVQREVKDGYRVPVNNNFVPSDTFEFVNAHLKEPLGYFSEGDYTDPMFQKHIWGPLWGRVGSTSKVILIANDLEPMRAGPWVTFVDKEGQNAYYASNNDYFKDVIRGPLHEALLRKKKEEEEKNKPTVINVGKTGDVVTPYTHGMFQPNPSIVRGIAAIFSKFSQESNSTDIAGLAQCTFDEFKAIVKEIADKEFSGDLMAGFLEHMTKQFIAQEAKMTILQSKHERATKRIEELTNQKAG